MAKRGTRSRNQRHQLLWMVVLFLWTCFIWVHSLIPGPASSEESLAFLRIIKPVLMAVGFTDMDLAHLLIRKVAHFSEYAVLGFLTYKAIRPRLRPPLAPALFAMLLWVGVPSVDEFIQLHVPGRAGLPTDVLIDMCGFGCGFAIAHLVQLARGNKKRARRVREQAG